MQPRIWLPIAALAAILVGPGSLCVAKADETDNGQEQYEQAAALVTIAIRIKDLGIREKQLDKAQAIFEDFFAKQPKHPLAPKAMNELGNLLVQRAGAQVERAKRPSFALEKTALLLGAQGKYEKSIASFAKLEVGLRTRLEALPRVLDPKTDAKQIEERDQLRADYLQTQILLAAVREEMAETEPKGSMAHKDILLTAARQYQLIYEKYRTRLAGLYARLYQGRCYAKLNDHKEALVRLTDLFDMPDQPREFRDLKVKTLLQAAECWFAAMPRDYDSAVRRIDAFLALVPADEKKEENVLALQLWLAKAYQGQSEDIQEREPDNKSKIAEPLQKSKELFRFVSEQESAVQVEARQALLKLGDAKGNPGAKPEPKTFDEFKAAGKAALEGMQSATQRVAELTRQIAKEKDAERSMDLERQLTDAKQAVESGRADAFKYFRLALRKSTPETDTDDLNVIKYFLTFLHYNQGDFHESAVLGEHVARRYSESAGARQCAKIAMASYLRIYKESKATDKAFESAKITGIAEYIFAKWPQEPEAVDAIIALIPFKIRDDKLAEAEDYLAKIPAESAARGEAELKVGQSLWSRYLIDDQKDGDGRGPKEEGVVVVLGRDARQQEIINRAEKILASGVARLQISGNPSATAAAAVLSLAEIYLETSRAEKALKLLEDPKIGALTLVQRKDPTIMREGFAEQTLKAALRAYVWSLEDVKATDAEARVKKIASVIAGLKETAVATPGGQKKLVSLFTTQSNTLKARMVDIASPDIRKPLLKAIDFFEKANTEIEK